MYKVGISTDIHRLKSGEELVLGGIKFDHHLGLVGHSDADVLLHSIIEAIIGALGLGDIGEHFADNDDAYAGINSMKLLLETKKMLDTAGYEIVNIDSLILLEQPRLKTYKKEMEQNISEVLGIRPEQINVKATTGEKIGFIGREEGIAAQATVLIKEK